MFHSFGSIMKTVLCLTLAGASLASALDIRIDYTYDTQNFFDTEEKRDAMESVAAFFGGLIKDNLTRHLDARSITSFGAIMLELYPKGPIAEARQDVSSDPLELLAWFDADNYREKIHPVYQNLWIQGGVRDRVFFAKRPERAPTLSKVPLVRWHWRHVYVSSTHQMLPRRLNHVFDRVHDRRVTGVLLHTKFLPDIMAKSQEELTRRQHFQNSDLYTTYHQHLAQGPDLWCPQSTRYQGWTQLTALGLMSKGDWV